MLKSRKQALAPLIDTVIIGEVQMRDAMTMQGWQPRRFAPEAEAFEDRCFYFCSGTFKVGDNDIRCTENAIDLGGEQSVHSPQVDNTSYTSVEQDVADKGYYGLQANSQKNRK